MARRDRPPIQKCLRRGDEIIVQIIKEGIGTKGPTLSTYVSIPGRILVMMPGMSKLGVSRKIEDEEERKRLRQILDGLKPPKDCGFIIRTAGIGKSKADIERDLKYLTRLFETLNKKAKSSAGPMELYAEGDLVTRTVRDVMTSDVERIVVDNEDVARKIKEFFKLVAPRTKNKVDLYEEPVPLFHKYGIEKEIELMYSRHVPLPSGGSLVIDSTEAIVAIDVNSGKSRDPADAETTAFKTDLEAADEIPRQLRLRDLGGIIICDFIDLRFERHRRELEKRLHENLNSDRAKTKMLRMSQFGIIEMTRQRMRPSLKRSIYSDCPHCKGAGLVKTPESMSLDVMRRLAIGAHDARVVRVELAVCQEVAFYLQNKKRSEIARLEQQSGKRIIVRVDATMGLDESKLELYDSRDGLVLLAELGMTPADHAGHGHGANRPSSQQQGRGRGGREERGRGGRGGRNGRDEQRGGRDQRPQGRGDARNRREESPADDRFDVESVEERVDQREEDRAEQAARDARVRAPLPQPEPAYEGDIEAAPEPAFDEEMGGENDLAEAPGEVEDEIGEQAEELQPVDDHLDEEHHETHAEDEAEAYEEEQPQPQQVAPPPPPPAPAYEDYEEEIELQPRGITHERPTLKDRQRGGGRGGRGGGGGGGGRGGRGGGRGGRGGQPQQKVDLGPPQKRGEGEMSLAERFAMELAAEKAAKRPQQQGGGQRPQQGGGQRPQQGGGQRPQQGGGHRQQQGGGQGGQRPQQNQQPRQQQPQQFQQPRQDANQGGGQGGQAGQGGPGGQGGGEEGGRRGGRRRRRGRGGRGRGGAGGQGGPQGPAGSNEPQGDYEQEAETPQASSRPAQSPPPVTPVQRTGSTDRHLLHDEPILPQPLSRPNSYRDLDQIPDDLD
jgi:Rne/Rng family ribonuclease